jgi:hypothetical protein
MSYAHIKFVKKQDTPRSAIYIVRSPDFDAQHQWLDIAEIEIDKMQDTYKFEAIGVWTSEKIVPPFVYEKDDDEIERLIANEYQGHGYGAWTGRIASQINRLIHAKEYPEEA